MRYYLKTLMLLFSIYASAQTDTVIYYSKLSNIVDSKKEAFTYVDLKKKSEGQFEMTQFQKRNGKWKDEYKTMFIKNSDTSFYLINSTKKVILDTLLRCFSPIDSGFQIYEYKDKFLISKGFSYLIMPLIQSGNWYYYNRDSKIEKEEFYCNNQMINNKYWINDTEFVNNVFIYADKVPEYKDGTQGLMEYIASNTIYPKSAVKNGIEGTVFVQIILTETGLIKGPKIVRGVEQSLNDEALRVISSIPNYWTPAIKDNKKVSFQMILPIRFVLR